VAAVVVVVVVRIAPADALLCSGATFPAKTEVLGVVGLAGVGVIGVVLSKGGVIVVVLLPSEVMAVLLLLLLLLLLLFPLGFLGPFGVVGRKKADDRGTSNL